MEENERTLPPPDALALQKPHEGLSATALKNIAVVAMMIDHVAWAFVPTDSVLGVVMHFVGRITGPTMFYFVAEGYHHSRDVNRYTWRLGVFALFSWLPFYYFEFGMLPSWPALAPFGVIYTLFLGLLAIRVRHEVRSTALKVLAIVVLMLLSSFGDWPFYGVLLPLLFDVFRGSYKRQAIAAACVFAWSVVPNVVVLLAANAAFTLDNYAFTIIQLGQFLPLGLLHFYNGQRGRGGKWGKWFFYVVYPAHLILLGLLKYEVIGLPRGMF